MRVTALALAALAVSSLAAGAAAARDPKAPLQRHTAADTKLARAIVLRKSDFAAGWTLQPPAKPGPPCTAAPDESKLVQTALLDPTYVWRDGVTTIGSEVDVFRKAADARADWRVSTLKVMRACYLQAVRRAVGAKRTVRVASARSLPPLTPGERSLHYRLAFVLDGNTADPLVTEVVGIGAGRITVVLHTLSFRAPPPTSALSALGAKLAKRLLDATGGI